MEGPFNKAIRRGGRMKISSILILLIIVFVLLAWGGISLYRKGYAAAEAIYQQKAVASAMTKIENTETLECKKIELKQRKEVRQKVKHYKLCKKILNKIGSAV